MKSLRIGFLAAACLTVGLAHPWTLVAQAPAPAQGVSFAAIDQTDLEEWLTYLSSDALQGRQVFTEGYGLAAAYVAQQLEAMGAVPMGDNGYFQTVKRVGYRVTRNSSVTVEVNGQSRTFAHGDHVTFPTNGGGRQTLAFDSVEFSGYGMVNLGQNYDDFQGRQVRDELVIWMSGTPAVLAQGGRGGGRTRNRSNYIVQTMGAAGTLNFAPAPAPPSPEVLAAQAAVDEANAAVAEAEAQLQAARAGAGGRGGGGRGGFGRGGGRGAAAPPDLTTVQSVNLPVAPMVTADEEFFTFLFSGSGQSFADIRAKATAGEPLVPFTLEGVNVTVEIDNTYEVASTQLTKNVVAMVEGSDPVLKDTYVMFGAHLDHSGYRTAPRGGGRGGRGAEPAPGPPDLILNGADDDGSGSTGLLGIAKAFATGPKPKRSVVFVWHSGEEGGLLGSRYMADFPVVPLEAVQAQFNMDMIGRNRDDDESLGNTVFVIGADRISTDLHNLVEASNAGMDEPLTLDYEYNDPSDPNSFYTRSDHYSYAAKGVPAAFFFTGTHPDYHQASDHVEKILFSKLRQISQLVYQAGFGVADREEALERDNLGPRAGRGFSGRIAK